MSVKIECGMNLETRKCSLTNLVWLHENSMYVCMYVCMYADLKSGMNVVTGNVHSPS